MVGTVISAIESRGLNIKHLQQKTLLHEEAIKLYKEHIDKWHFERNIKHMTSGPVILLEIEGKEALNKCREYVMYFRNIYKDMVKLPRNLIHATDRQNNVANELLAVNLSAEFLSMAV